MTPERSLSLACTRHPALSLSTMAEALHCDCILGLTNSEAAPDTFMQGNETTFMGLERDL